jgi:hypothetical protein
VDGEARTGFGWHLTIPHVNVAVKTVPKQAEQAANVVSVLGCKAMLVEVAQQITRGLHKYKPKGRPDHFTAQLSKPWRVSSLPWQGACLGSGYGGGPRDKSG